MKDNFLKAYNGLQVPDELVKKAKHDGGFTLYLSGGGFRGWGYLLLYQAQKHKKEYPISIINGFVARKKDFTDTKRLGKVAKQAKRTDFTYRNFAQREHVFMRWKEYFLVPDHRVRTISGASFEGFYYICFNQIEGSVSGVYFHAKSERYV